MTHDSSRKLGLFGGSFDPVHNGHLALAGAALRELRLDRVFFIPARRSPFKAAGPLASDRDRAAMLRAALRGRRRFALDLSDLRRKGPSYTYKTLRSFRRRYPGSALFLLVGGDSWRSFQKWRRWREIFRGAVIVVASRGQETYPHPQPLLYEELQARRIGQETLAVPRGEGIKYLNARLPAVSSSEVRRRLCAGRSVRGLIPPVVERCIRRRRLYQE